MRGRMKKRRRAKPLPRLARLILPRRIFSQPLPMVTANCCKPFGDHDRMRKEKRKSLTDTMRRSLCQQLDEEFHRCEWVQIIKQATRQGWLKFYPLDKDKPTSTVPEFESAGDQIRAELSTTLKEKMG